jgi:hypothetical protein
MPVCAAAEPDIISINWRGRTADDGKEFLSRRLVLSESAEHVRSDHGHFSLVDAARCHALVLGFDDDRDAVRLEHFIDGICDLSGHLFLDLKPLGEHFHDSCQLADAYDALIWQVRDMRAACAQDSAGEREQKFPRSIVATVKADKNGTNNISAFLWRSLSVVEKRLVCVHCVGEAQDIAG